MKKTASFFIAFAVIIQIFCISGYAQSSVFYTEIHTNKKDALKLSWENINGADYYAVFRKDNASDKTYHLIDKVEDNSYIDYVPKINKTYYYFIRARISKNEKIDSKPIFSAVVPLEHPKINLSEENGKCIKIEWKADKNASFYKVYRKNSKGSFDYIGSSAKNNYLDYEILEPNKLFFYKIIPIKKINGSNYSGNYSDEVYIKTSNEYQKDIIPKPDNDWAYFLVNKENYLPEGFKVELSFIKDNILIDKRCVEYTNQMFDAAEKEGIYLKAISGFRSYERQRVNLADHVQLFINNGYDSDKAYTYATMEIAPPGASEHNAGIALDILAKENPILSVSFDQTPEFEWLKNNSWKYGFVLRYLKGKENITGYIYEPWHFRFLGLYHAEKLTVSGLCLEEYFNTF